MEITHYQPPVARNSHDIQLIAESVPFSSKDKQQIDKARVQTQEINQTIDRILADPAHAPSHKYFCWLHNEVDRIEAELIDNPSYENAERFHAAIVRFNQAKDTQQRVGGALQLALQRVSQSLTDIVNSLLDATRKKIIAEADKRRAELATSNRALFSNEDEKRTLEARVQVLIHELNSERTEAMRDPLSWLDRAGLAMDDITEPQAEDAA